MKALLIIVSIIALVLAGIAYYFYDMHNKLQAELEASRNAQEELNFKISSLEQKKDKIKRELGQKIADISKEKEDEIARVKGTYDELVANMKEEIVLFASDRQIVLNREDDEGNVLQKALKYMNRTVLCWYFEGLLRLKRLEKKQQKYLTKISRYQK